MPKISYSLAIAFAFHILVLYASTYFVDMEPVPVPFSVDSKNTINLNFGSSTGGQPRKSAPSQARNNISAQATTLTTSNDVSAVETSASGNDTGTGSASGNGSGDGTYDFGSTSVSYKEPIYPRMAIRREMQGIVKVRIKITPEGIPSNTEILKSSGHDILDKAVLDAIVAWRFQHKSSFYFVEKNIVFQLKN